MPTYLTPGVYIEEIATGARPIEAVGTSTAGFVGVAPNDAAHVNAAIAINNWSQFKAEFVVPDVSSTPLAQAVFGFFQNGGSRCYVINVGKGAGITGDGGVRKGVELLEEIDEVAIVAAPGFSDAASYEALLGHCENLKDRVAILDPPLDVSNTDLLQKVATVAVPKPARTDGAADAVQSSAEDVPGLRPRISDGGFGAFYFPWITILDPLSGQTVSAPPSGHIAGIYARTDASRGVHKAPANETVRGALNLSYRVTEAEQGELNRSGVNCIRFFSREGIRIWGARTLADSSSEWRYLNIRRFFIMVEESIARSTRWIVFEPNAQPLWKSIRRDIGAFLTLLWRQGALMGKTPEEAFFVLCDEETNPQEVIDAGMVIAVIGIAALKPAEFVVFRIGQSVAGAKIDNQGGSNA